MATLDEHIAELGVLQNRYEHGLINEQEYHGDILKNVSEIQKLLGGTKTGFETKPKDEPKKDEPKQEENPKKEEHHLFGRHGKK